MRSTETSKPITCFYAFHFHFSHYHSFCAHAFTRFFLWMVPPIMPPIMRFYGFLICFKDFFRIHRIQVVRSRETSSPILCIYEYTSRFRFVRDEMKNHVDAGNPIMCPYSHELFKCAFKFFLESIKWWQKKKEQGYKEYVLPTGTQHFLRIDAVKTLTFSWM